MYVLAACLRDEVPESVDWQEVIRQANDHLVTPRLHSVFRSRSQSSQRIPDELKDYLQCLHDLNVERNLRLRAQALEAISVLNAAGIEPTLLKGTIVLLTCPAADLGSRMLSDIDILLRPDHLEQGSRLLRELGYRQAAGNIGEHAHGKFYRPQDAGAIDLHHRPAGPRKLYPTLQRELGELHIVGGYGVRLPAPTSRVVHLIAHDMFNDGGLATGRIQLRHIFDIADLAQREEVDWRSAAARFSAAKRSLAFDIYVLTLLNVAKVIVSEARDPSLAARLLFHRQMLKDRSKQFRQLDDVGVRLIRQWRQNKNIVAAMNISKAS